MSATRRESLIAVLVVVACSQPAPQPRTAPDAVVSPAGKTGSMHVTATTLNVRSEASSTSRVITQVKRGDSVTVLEEGDGWSKVRLPSGEEGWVASQHISGGKPRATKPGCETQYSFVKTPVATFSENGPHGLVVVDATVNTKGEVTATKVVSNSTGDPTLASMAEREIRSATFKPPYRDCVPRSFIFTYKRSF